MTQIIDIITRPNQYRIDISISKRNIAKNKYPIQIPLS